MRPGSPATLPVSAFPGVLARPYYACSLDGESLLCIRAAVLSHTVAPSASIHMKVNIPVHIRSRI